MGRLSGRSPFNPDSTRIASASEDNAVRVWDAGTGKEIGVLRGHAAFVIDVAFSPDGRCIASASDDGKVKLWNTAVAEPRADDAAFLVGEACGVLPGRRDRRHGGRRSHPALGGRDLPADPRPRSAVGTRSWRSAATAGGSPRPAAE